MQSLDRSNKSLDDDYYLNYEVSSDSSNEEKAKVKKALVVNTSINIINPKFLRQ